MVFMTLSTLSQFAHLVKFPLSFVYSAEFHARDTNDRTESDDPERALKPFLVASLTLSFC